MITGMTTKIAVSLPDELVAAARRAVAEGRSASVSAYVGEALAERRADEDFARMLDEMDDEYGQPTAEHFAWARSALGLAE
jgi:Arc/MetJ-type ribon-helix-helix transcriptional regulator